MIEIRTARAEDAKGIAAVHVRGWQEAYSHIFPAEFLDNLATVISILRWARTIESDTVDVWLAEDDAVVGWATAGPGRDSDGPRGRELHGIYLLASHYGTGIGQRLLDAALGDRPPYLWVLEVNPRAQAFYRRNGFDFDGARKLDRFGGHPVSELRMVR